MAWAGLIFYLSTGGFGGGFSEALLAVILRSVHIRVSPHEFEAINFVFRKLAHLTEYAIFAMLIYGSVRECDPFRWRPRLAFWTVVIAALYSLTDEFHQRFVPGRGPTLVDCAIDTAGAGSGILLYYIRSTLLEKKAAKIPAETEILESSASSRQ